MALIVVPESPHPVTQRGVRSLPIFRGDEDRKSHLEFKSQETQRFRVGILAWCFMTKHVPLIAVPEDERGLARAIGEAHQRYSRMRNFAEGVRGLGEQKIDVLVKDRNLLGLVANWREFFQGEDSGGEKDLRHAMKAGRPLVDHEHLARIEKKTGRNLQKGKPGPKSPDSMK